MNDIDKLKSILSRSKAVMDKTEGDYGGNNTAAPTVNSYGEKEMPNLTESMMKNPPNRSTRSVAPQNGRYKNIENTKMPQEIVNAMINNPIEIPDGPYPTFELDQVTDLVNESPLPNTIQQPITSKKPSISKNTVRQIVKEEIEGVVRDVIEEYLDKALITEDIQIKIGSTIFSGNLKPLPKKRKRRI